MAAGKGDACRVMVAEKPSLAREIGRVVGTPAAFKAVTVGTCPQCRDHAVVEHRKGFGCVGFRENGCDFVLWKDYLNKRLTTRHAVRLLAGEVVAARQLRGRSGRAFDAGLKLKLGAYNHLELVFSDREGGSARPRMRRADGRVGAGRRAAQGAAARKGLGRRRASNHRSMRRT